jgi:hypothetical protein
MLWLSPEAAAINNLTVRLPYSCCLPLLLLCSPAGVSLAAAAGPGAAGHTGYVRESSSNALTHQTLFCLLLLLLLCSPAGWSCAAAAGSCAARHSG